MSGKPEIDRGSCPIIYVMVVGFHHKKGCLIDFCYPPLSMETSGSSKDSDHGSIELPTEWKSLPSLAIPDGAHNFDNDTVFFHLPDLDDPNRTVFGVACYQQVPTKTLLVRTPDMTRSSVQKSVVALLRYPLYGWIERKLKIVTRSYFAERDFSRTEILEKFHHSISLQLKPTLLETTEIFHGLSLRWLFGKFGAGQILALFKLLLLERKILFIMSPIRQLCGTILAICSLFPGLLQEGMLHSHLPNDFFNNINKSKKSITVEKISSKIESEEQQEEMKNNESLASSTISAYGNEDADDDDDLVSIDDNEDNHNSNTTVKEYQEIFIKNYRAYGLPLQLFKCHSYCLPYCSISCFETLNHERVRSCLAGSSNTIFQRWENDIDVFVTENQILIQNTRLKRLLTPTIEDSQFISFLMRTIDPSGENHHHNDNDDDDELPNDQPPDDEDYLFSQKFEPYDGSDSWIRNNFKNYLLHMLRCSLSDETSKEYRSFNSGFMSEWKTTYNYNQWCNQEQSIMNTIMSDVEPIHPFSGIRPLNDIKFKISNFFNNRHEQVNQASKQVLTTARTTFSSWMTSLAGSYHGQQAKTLLNKTVQLANQLIEDDDDDDSPRSSISSVESGERNNGEITKSAKRKPKLLERKTTNKNSDSSSSFGFIGESDDDEPKEQETSV